VNTRPDRRWPVAILPVTAGLVMTLAASVLIHGDTFERNCGMGGFVSSALIFTGWFIAMLRNKKSRA